ncbi:hypothetical protein LCGC14_0500140 [marine sediment metagenome]|uniref:Uncharacterized protein n=1 Tax=marine sediment metagenome TaxID=412755 RepID=A0A0F9UQY1_9ZZZZ
MTARGIPLFVDSLITVLAAIGEWLGFGQPQTPPLHPWYAGGVLLPAHWIEKGVRACDWCGSPQAKDRLSCIKCGGAP